MTRIIFLAMAPFCLAQDDVKPLRSKPDEHFKRVAETYGISGATASNSPEIDFYYTAKDGSRKAGGISMGPTMDLAIIRDLFDACVRASELLDRDPEFRSELKNKLERLLPYPDFRS